jgi:CubicO group peptidase (beta-lactamase class C family)
MTGGGLGLSSRDLLKLGQLYLNHGAWGAAQVAPAAWVETSLAPHVQIDDETEYGYLWWRKTFSSAGRPFQACYMTGTGGNRVMLFPQPELAVVITTTNYNVGGAHALSDRLLTEYILGAV